jgi:CheY-like chemotaxis protein
MSHEIRTPLTAIIGFTELLRDDAPDQLSAQQRTQTVDTIKNAGVHLLTVINDILDLSKIEANMLAIERIETSIIDILNVIVDLLRPRSVGKGVAFDVELATPLPRYIYSDPTRLRQILMNLAGNAVKFTQTGAITIRAGTERLLGTERLVIDVLDTGSGLTAEGAERLFQAFSQADDTVTRKHGGTGLGLKISRRLAELMGGSVTLARTELGKGSCFRVNLPIEIVVGSGMVHRLEAVKQTAREKASTTVPNLYGRVLLAEDGPDNQRLIAYHLKKAGAEIDVADNGRIALGMIEQAAAQGRPYELLLTDMQMPEMDGYTLAKTLRVQGNRLPIVALTAHAMAEDRQKCLDAGCDDYASKPIDKHTLLTTCNKWLNPAPHANAESKIDSCA